MKRILIFSTAYLPFIGGAEIAIKEITSRIDDIEFDLITAKLKSDLLAKEKIDNITVYRVGFGFWLDKFLLPIFGLTLALKLHKTQKYSLAWAMMASQASVAAVFFKQLKKIKLLTTLQEGDEEEHLKRYAFGNSILYSIFIKPWHTLAIKKADHIQVISEYLAKRAKSAGGKCDIDIIPNGVDMKTFDRLPAGEAGKVPKPELDFLKERLGIKSNEKIAISVSRLVLKNGLDVLIEAFSLLTSHSELVSGSSETLKQVQSDSSVRLILIGVGNQESRLKALVHDLGLNNKVLFLGSVDNSEIPKYLSMADVFVRPSRSEGQGISFLEAMAAGVPVVATPVGGIVDFIVHEKTGLLAEVDNPADVAQNIQKLLADESLRNEIIKNSQKLVREKYDWDNISKQIEQLFNKLIKEV